MSLIEKYDPNQPRDNRGRWASMGGGASLGQQVKPSFGAIGAMEASIITGPHIDPEGNFTPERQALHDKIISDFLEGVPAQAHPVMYMNGGGPASGKSSLTAGANSAMVGYPKVRTVDDITGKLSSESRPGAVLIDPDALKLQLPEVHAMKAEGNHGWAAAAHEESSFLSKRLLQAAMDRRVNIINDGTGDSGYQKVMARVAQARNAGYRVEANYLHANVETAIGRALARGKRTGRMVPPSVIRHTYADIPVTFRETAQNARIYDKVRLFTTEGIAQGQPARLIAEGDASSFNVTDWDTYGRFLSGV